MRYILIIFALLLNLPAAAQEASLTEPSEIRGQIYNMCRGGGYAYELEPQYADNLDAECLKETEALMAEYPQRARDAAKARYLDYCITKESERAGHVVSNPNCAYMDARFVNDPWSVIMEGSHDDMTKIFHDLIQLPAPLQEVKGYLQRSGFNCEKPNNCSIVNPAFGLGTKYIYTFDVQDQQVTTVTSEIISPKPR